MIRMGDKQIKSVRGMTLIEVVVATVIISIAAAGALSYEYHAASQTKMASAYAGAVRIGDFLLEDWKANGGSTFYANGVPNIHSPLNLRMGFVKIADADTDADGVYRVSSNDIPMQVELQRLETADYQQLIPLRVTVRWRNDFTNDVINNTIPSSAIVLNTYARVDQAGG